VNFRGLIQNNKPVYSWRDRFEQMGGWATIPNRGFQMKKSGEKAEILIYEQIGMDFWTGGGVTAKQFAEDLKALGDVKELDIRINSPGGEVYEADAIYSQLNSHKATKNVFIDGLAASAASYIAMVGDSIKISEHAKFMIHNAWGLAIGNANDMEQTAGVLRALDASIRLIYQRRTGNTDKQLSDWMEAETWFSASEAVANKFADSLITAKGTENKTVDASHLELMKMRLAVARAS
jgi:ATP-dependent Clp protease, protease subunit